MFLSKAEENIAFRSSFLVDPEGVIVSMEKCDIPVKRQIFYLDTKFDLPFKVGRSMEELVRRVGMATGMEDDLSSSKVGLSFFSNYC